MKLEMPAVILTNPKYSHNLAGAIRACSCFGIKTLLWTGDRIQFKDGERLPREERMKGYRDVRFEHSGRPFDQFVNPNIVCVELAQGSQPLTHYGHSWENSVYVFGPEDGSVPQVYKRFCHEFVFIPSYHCLNLAAAINVVLAHRMIQRQHAGLEPVVSVGEMLKENRGYIETVQGWEGQ